MKKYLVFCGLLLISTYVFSEEQADLTVPYKPDPSQTTFLKVEALSLDWPDQIIEIRVGDGNGISRRFSYTGDTAKQFMIALNKANLSGNSLQRRILSRLIADGKLSGTISGVPD